VHYLRDLKSNIFKTTPGGTEKKNPQSHRGLSVIMAIIPGASIKAQ
jgi:hypothetical protein